VTALTDLADAIDGLCAADPATLADSDTIQALQRQLARLEAATVRATAAFDATGEWRASGARSAAAWISVRCRLPLPTCRRRVHLGRAVRHMPTVEAAWLAGDVSGAHVGVLAEARTPATAEAFTRDEALLVGHASSLRFRPFQRLVAYWCQLADPDGVERTAAAQRESRRLHVSQSIDGMWFVDGRLDPVGGAIVAEALRKVEHELFEADWADGKERLGEHVTASGLTRTAPQRRADAFVELATRAQAAPPGGRRPEPLFTVFVGYETLAGRICELADGTVVTPGSLVPWLPDGWVERAVFDGPDRVVGLGQRRRLFTGALRRAVQLQGRECFHEYCDQPADHTEIDHIQPYAAGGATTIDNGRPACAYHNRWRHQLAQPP
jgi:Domain of unknown function (DUF222)/HNH endonuclease